MKIYFAHPINTYGDRIEKYAIDFIYKLYPDCVLINPNSPEHQIGYERVGMKYFRKIVRGCDRIVVLPFSDGSIGAGMGKEILWALKFGIKVIQLKPFEDIEEIFNLKFHRVLTVEETRIKLKRDDRQIRQQIAGSD